MSDLLRVEDLAAGYGPSQVLFGINMALKQGQCITLLGRNGMGKTTLIKNIMGQLKPWSGAILLRGTAIQGKESFRIAQAGIGLVPEGREIFPNLTVRENLIATAAYRSKGLSPWNLARVYHLFPRLQERASNFGNQLSGGEQQMLAIGRALMTNPFLLILDEATEGLAPVVRQEIWAALSELRREGMSLLVVDKNIVPLKALADRHFVIEKGQIRWEGTSATLGATPELLQHYLGV